MELVTERAGQGVAGIREAGEPSQRFCARVTCLLKLLRHPKEQNKKNDAGKAGNDPVDLEKRAYQR